MCPYNIYTTMKRKSQIIIKENNILLQSYTKKAEKSKQHHIFSPYYSHTYYDYPTLLCVFYHGFICSQFL